MRPADAAVKYSDVIGIAAALERRPADDVIYPFDLLLNFEPIEIVRRDGWRCERPNSSEPTNRQGQCVTSRRADDDDIFGEF